MKLQKTIKVSAGLLGSDEYLSTLGIFEVVEEILTELMGNLHIDGIVEKEKYNAFWVFTKNRIKILKKIRWNEPLFLTAFISNKSLVKLNLDVDGKDSLGNQVFYSHVEACALDLTSKRVRKLVTVGVDEKIIPEDKNMEIEFSKFEEKDLKLIETVKVRSTNIDMSHHTNNLEYLRFIFNTYSVKDLESRFIKEIEINYLSQSFELDTLNIKRNSGKFDTIVLEKEKEPIVRCEIIFEEKE